MERFPIFILLNDFRTEEDEFNNGQWKLVPDGDVILNVCDIKRVREEDEDYEGLKFTVIEMFNEDENLYYSNRSPKEIMEQIKAAITEYHAALRG